MLNYDEIYRIAMFGHRDFNCHRQLEERLIPVLRDLIRKKKFIEIYMGRDGEFDTYAATLVKRVQKDYDDYHAIEFNLVLPYPKKDMEDFEKYYDRVDIPISAHPKLAITKRNEGWQSKPILYSVILSTKAVEHTRQYNMPRSWVKR